MRSMVRGVRECVWCREDGHFCPGAVRLDGEPEGEPDRSPDREPMGGLSWLCLDCADEKACVHRRVAGRGRESGASARASVNVYGELVFERTPAPVIARTPEELGLPRVVMEEKRPRVKAVEAQRKTLRQECVSRERKLKIMGSVKSARGKTTREIPEEIREALLSAPATESRSALAARLGISDSPVYRLRASVGKSSREGRPRTRVAESAPVETAPREADPDCGVETHAERTGVHVDVPDARGTDGSGRDGGEPLPKMVLEELSSATAANVGERLSASDEAMGRGDWARPRPGSGSGRVPVTVELNVADVFAMVQRMSERDQQLFLHGGVTALLGATR